MRKTEKRVTICVPQELFDNFKQLCDKEYLSISETLRSYMKVCADDCLMRFLRNPINKDNIMSRPKIVCLCGSTRFKDAYTEAMKRETLAGKIVLTVGLFGHLEGIDMSGPTKKMLDELHLRKIDLADEILVINVDGYIGESTKREIKYATDNNKEIRYLEN